MHLLSQFVRRLPPLVEFVVVVVCTLGWTVIRSTTSLLAGKSEIHFTDADLLRTLAFELAALVFAAGFLHLRGWRIRQLCWGVSLRSTRHAVFLIIIALGSLDLLNIILTLLTSIVSQLAPISQDPAFMPMAPGVAPMVGESLSFPVILLVSAINGFYEETVLMGYVARRHQVTPWFRYAPLVSMCIRLAYHTYQGPYGLLSVAIMGIVFTYSYARDGKLWPLIVAHTALDIWGLLSINTWP